MAAMREMPPREQIIEWVTKPVLYDNRIIEAWKEVQRWPLMVVYRGSGEAEFIPRECFVWGEDMSPSACVWIVPGSWKRDQ